MKIILTPKSDDRDFCKITIDGFDTRGVTDERTQEMALDILQVLAKDYLKIEWVAVHPDERK